MFEKATRLKLRFATSKGVVTTEDLWDMSLDQLDKVAISHNKELKSSTEESFIKEKTKANETLELKLGILKHIINTKLEEREAKLVAKEKEQKKSLIKELIEKKKMESLESKSLEDLQKELDNI